MSYMERLIDSMMYPDEDKVDMEKWEEYIERRIDEERDKQAEKYFEELEKKKEENTLQK